MHEITTPNGVYKVFGVPSEALLKKLSRPYRKPAIRKPDYDYPIEEAENHGVVFPTREREREKNRSRCERFNTHFQELSGTTLNGMMYNDISAPSIVKGFSLYNHEEERDKLLQRHGVLLTPLSHLERNKAAEKILLEILQTTQDDLLQEDCGDTTNRELCVRWNERYHDLGGIGFYRYMGSDKPEFVSAYSNEERDKLIKRNGHKLSGLNDRKRFYLCCSILDEIRKEVES